MSKLSMTEAVKVIPVSESTLRRDLKSGKVSFETDAKGRKQIDVSELTRVYGPLNEPPAAVAREREPVNETPENPSLNGNETPEMVALLQNQVADLKAQLEKADVRETALISPAFRWLVAQDPLKCRHDDAVDLVARLVCECQPRTRILHRIDIHHMQA